MNLFLTTVTVIIIIVNLLTVIKLVTKITNVHINFFSIKWKNLLKYIVSGFLINISFGIIVSLFFSFLTTNQKSVDDISLKMPFFLFFLFAVISSPILEELVCRLFIMGYAFKGYPLLGIIISIIVFIIPHRPSNLGEFIVYLGPAICYSGIFFFSKRIEYSILFHMFINILSIL